MSFSIAFDPVIPLGLLWALLTFCAVLIAISAWRRMPAWILRASAMAVIILVLAQPLAQQEERRTLPDYAVILVDNTSSQSIAPRQEQTQRAVAHLQDQLGQLPNLRVATAEVLDSAEDQGTQLGAALRAALEPVPEAQLGAVFVVSDGRVHDASQLPDLPAPVHVLQTGRDNEWDLALSVINAPNYAILNEKVTFQVKIEVLGAVPEDLRTSAEIDISVDGGPMQRARIPVGVALDVPLSLRHAGINVIEFALVPQDGELTSRNNRTVLRVNGVRDRLRVLLVSGEPHAGTRTWRNLLKSDPAVDLVHFTILRPPNKQDGVPVSELSLIAFPTRELFLEKVEDFDLIIFDRYQRRGILPSAYLENVVRYVQNGGAVLASAGPDFASAQSLYRSPLGRILPAKPDARLLSGSFVPQVTELGARHPITAGLLEEQKSWGPWRRQVGLIEASGDVVMRGADNLPLLVVSRVGEGRVALIASDQTWLWDRGYEGGGPQDDLLRRLSHWMMKEPELEENRLDAVQTENGLAITRYALRAPKSEAEIETPDGDRISVPLRESKPGVYEGLYPARTQGLYRVRSGELKALVGKGEIFGAEFADPLATAEHLGPIMVNSGGGLRVIRDGLPSLRLVPEGRKAEGRGWLGIFKREAYARLGWQEAPLLPAWFGVLLAAGLVFAAWLREGRRRA